MDPLVSPIPRTYFMSAKPYDGWTKIGRTIAPTAKNRLGGCQTGNPRPLCIRAEWPVNVEAELHRLYASLRGCGEWFALPYEMLQDCARLGWREGQFDLVTELWPPERIWRIARETGSTKRSRTPEAAARAFISRTAAERAKLPTPPPPPRPFDGRDMLRYLKTHGWELRRIDGSDDVPLVWPDA